MLLLAALCCMASLLHAAPLARRMVDLSYTFDETTVHHPTMKTLQTTMLLNGTNEMGVWIQIEEYTSAIHVGTHIDAPAHFLKGGMTVDEIPLSRLIAPAAVVDTTAKAELDPEAETTIQDLLHWESITGQSLNGTILLLRTGWGRKWNDPAAFYGTDDYSDPTKLRNPSIAVSAAQWLVDNRNIFGIGVEPVSFDKGYTLTYPAHQILLGHGIFAMENVANMHELPIYGAELFVMPTKIGGGSGAPARIVALYPEVLYDRYSMGSGRYTDECHEVV